MKMEINRIDKDMNAVKIQTAQARGEAIDSSVKENIDSLTRDLVSDMSPHNRWLISQLVGFAVNEMVRPHVDLFQMVGDAKQIPIGGKAAFKVQLEGVKAFIQAKGATTPRSKVATKQVFVDTKAISARPVLNTIEMKTNQANMADLVAQAAREIEDKEIKYFYDTLIAAADDWSAPFYGTGSGMVKATIDPMVLHWMRLGGATIVGDIAAIAKLSELTGFTTATSTKQYAPELIVEHNNNGFIGRYLGADVVQFMNTYGHDNTTLLIPDNKLFILPKAISADMRPLKIVREGDIQSTDATNIDDLTYEIRLDQYFGAGVVVGNKPYLSVYAAT